MLNFRIFGIPVMVQWTFWLSMAFIGGAFSATTPEDWYRVLIFAFVGFISILVHEFGHALTARHFGASPEVVLFAFGGVTQYRGVSFSRLKSILITAAGPLFGFFLALLAWVLLSFVPSDRPMAAHMVGILLLINIVWSLLNLLPILPLDGGQILRDLLGPKHYTLTCWIGVLTCVLLIFPAYRSGFFIGAIFLGIFAFNNYKEIQKPKR